MINSEEIYTQYFNVVYKYLYGLSHNSDLAEELTQETFCRAIKTLHKFRGDCKINVWLCQIAKNVWYSELKKRKGEISLDSANIINLYDTNLEDTFIEKDEKQQIYNYINELEENQRNVVICRIVFDMSFKEIGLLLGKTENWARVNYYRGKNKILKGGKFNESKGL